MALVAIGITVGTPDVAAQVAVTATDGAALLATAQTDLTTLAGLITTAQTDATAADTATGTAQTDVGTVKTNTATVKTDATTADNNAAIVVTDIATVLTDIDAFAASVIAITGDTYVAHQFVTGGATGLTHAQWATQAALMNTAITALLAAQTAMTTAKANTATTKTDATTADNNAGTAVTDIATAKTATALAKTDANALSTTTVHNDIVAAQANFASNVTFRTDSSIVTTASVLSGALQAGLALVAANAILPP